ncbi:glycerol-3-phosphate 1-O-acyltransferase PlsY [Clostridium sp. DL1XJH146]
MLEYIIAAIVGYLLGNIQTAFIIGKLKGNIDIRDKGSKNAGASNVTIVLGWRYGIITAFVDIMKAVVAVTLIKYLFQGNEGLYFIAGMFAILGHIFPFYLKFRGGKGTASIIGMILAIDIKIALIAAIILVVVTILSDYIALGTIVMVIVWPIMKFIGGYSLMSVIMCALIAAISIYKHRINIYRIINNDETGLRSTFSK